MSELKVTSIEDIIKANAPKIVELPPFPDGTPFAAKLRRPSMLMLMKSGRIPNRLIETASGLFSNNKKSKQSENIDFTELVPMMEAVCEASLVEPTVKQLRENDVQLTDAQMNAIFAYSQKGAEGLEQFRRQSENIITD